MSSASCRSTRLRTLGALGVVREDPVGLVEIGRYESLAVAGPVVLPPQP